MKTSILKYGGYSALFGGILFMIGHFFFDDIDMGTREYLGWISILTALSFVFFGIKHYRDKVNNGIVTFGKALLIGLAISAIAGITMSILDIIYVTVINPDFSAEYVQYTLENMKQTLTAEEFEIQKAKMLEDMKMFDSPAFAGVFMFGLIFSTGIIVTLISSLVLQRK